MRSALVFIAIIVFGAGCTTQRQRGGELKGLKRLYHNTTAHYNGYFNANEILEASFVQLDQQHQDNYTKLLDFFPYIAATNAQAVSPGLDTAIKKVTVVVNLHRKSDWADDCYLLAGKAQFLKKDYEAAEATFRFLLNEYNPRAPKKTRPTTAAARSASAKERQQAARDKAEEREETAKAKKKEQERARKERAKKIKQQRREREKYNKQVRNARKKGKPAPRAKAYNTPKTDSLAQTPAKTQIETKQAKKKQEEEAKAKAKLAEEKKREEEALKKKDPNYFMFRRPAYQEGALWLAKTLIERDNLEAAQRLITQLAEDKNTFDYVKSELPAVQAYLNLKLKHREFAIQNLQEAVEVANTRAEKARYAFILAQLQQSLGNTQAAYASFEDVLKYSNDYEMEFSARLSMAQNTWSSGSGSSAEAIANLEKMLKDAKNVEYKDRIYFALANIALKAADKAKAIEYLQLSLQQPTQNQAQRVETYFTLATLYFEDENYIAAKNYYDSTLQILPPTDVRYAEVKRLSENLTDIANNLAIVILQDSLLRIANMSEEERKAFAADLKKRRDAEIEAAQNAQFAEANKNNAKPGLAQRTSVTNTGTAALQKPSDFPLYDEKQLRQGKREFQKQWGERTLEDDWRRSSRQIVASAQEDTAKAQEIVVNEKEMGDLLRGVPKSESEIKIAQIKVQEALFKLGTLYRDRLQNLPKSAGALEDLNNRYPGSSSELDSWYYLYLDYKDLNNSAKAKEYADKIIAKHPYSNYAKVIQDPSYIVEVQNEEKRLTQYYNEAYAAYTAGNFQEAYERSSQSNEKFGATNALRAKFALLSAMSVGNLKGKDEYIAALNEVIAKFPNTEEQKYAREVLRLLGASTGTLPGGQKVETEQFEVQNDQVHSVIIALTDPSALNEAKNAVSDYNRKYHDLEKLRISDVVLVNGEARTTLIVIRRFKDKNDALRYYQGVQKNSKDFIVNAKYEIYPISQGNYGKLFSTVKSIETYKTFFESNYR